MVTAEGGGNFKEQLWRTFRAIALTFLVISGVGALIEDRGISKGLLSVDSLDALLVLFSPFTRGLKYSAEAMQRLSN